MPSFFNYFLLQYYPLSHEEKIKDGFVLARRQVQDVRHCRVLRCKEFLEVLTAPSCGTLK